MSCPVCSSPVPPSQGRKARKFCSRRCTNIAAMRAWRARRRRPPKKHYCAAFGCERRFIRKPRTRRIYCSRLCRIRATSRTARALAKARRAA